METATALADRVRPHFDRAWTHISEKPMALTSSPLELQAMIVRLAALFWWMDA